MKPVVEWLAHARKAILIFGLTDGGAGYFVARPNRTADRRGRVWVVKPSESCSAVRMVFAGMFDPPSSLFVIGGEGGIRTHEEE